MSQRVSRQLRELMPLCCVFCLAALPFILLWRSPWGRGYALMIFFLGGVIVAANSFRRDVRRSCLTSAAEESEASGQTWAQRMLPLALALVVVATIFSSICLVFSEGVEDPFVAPMLAFMSLVPTLGITPYFVLALRKPFAAVVFTVSLVGSMKLAGCLIVVLLYSWDADEQGLLGMPWDHPNLLVWLFWSFTGALSLILFFLAARRFQTMQGSAASLFPQTTAVQTSLA
jgi:hypothetical protein